MGVLNIQEHLRHRRPRENEENNTAEQGWEEELFEPIQPQVPQEEPTQRSHSRGRSQKNKAQYFNKYAARKMKTGSRQMRRHENTCFLLSLVDQEELGELDFPDFVNNNVSAFASLFTNVDKLKIWNDFVNLPEEEQDVILGRETKTAAPDRQSDQETTDEQKQNERDAVAIAEKSFNRIEGRIRAKLTTKRFPLDGLKHYEEEVTSYFTDDPSAVMISVLPSSFDRLLMHGVCQYLNLASTSMDRNKVRIMEIENKHGTFCPPSVLLSQYLKWYR